jgi:transcriptional regulator with XRE-family HTH domain
LGELREALRLSQRDVADRIIVRNNCISYIESGKEKKFGPDSLADLLKFYQIPLEQCPEFVRDKIAEISPEPEGEAGQSPMDVSAAAVNEREQTPPK